MKKVILLLALAFSANAEYSELTNAIVNYTMTTFQKAYKPLENTIISPLSIHTSLSMFYPFAGTELTPYMSEMLHLNTNKLKVVDSLAGLLDELNEHSSGQLSVRSKLYHIEQQLQSSVIPTFRDRYGAETEPVNFQEPANVAKLVNQWVDGATEGRISQIVDEKDISTDNHVMLLNVVLLKASWEYPFDPESTVKEKFHFVDGERDTDMMQNMANYSCGFLEDLAFIELPYKKGSDLSLLLIQSVSKTLQQTVPTFDQTKYEKIDQALRHRIAIVKLPKFTTKSKIDVKKLLTELNMGELFETQDLEIVTNDRSRFGQVWQHGFIKVDEYGTEAAAVTEVQVEGRSFHPEFVFNKPFLYIIRNSSTKNIIFIGHYSV